MPPMPKDSSGTADTLHHAEKRSNDSADNALIAFASSLTSGGAATIHLDGSALELNDPSGTLTIDGPVSNSLTIDAGGSSEVFDIGNYSTAAISDLTITGGYGYNGGGINVSGASGNSSNGILTVTDCTITGNSAGRLGGGIYANYSTNLTVIGSTISGNSAASDGGGIFAYGGTVTLENSALLNNEAAGDGGGLNVNNVNATVTDCTISGNTATAGRGGGGIYNYESNTHVLDSTISGNSAVNGGGITNYGTLHLTNSTLYGNTATNRGGGLYLVDAFTTVTDCTIVGNSAASVDGGGIFSNSGTSYSNLYGTIVAGNTHGDCAGDALSGTYNLIGDGTGGLSTAPSSHNLQGTTYSPLNPLLAPLGNYGGPTETMALLPGSPAIGEGEVFSGVTADQRGISRSTTNPDIGAFESQGFIVTVTGGSVQSTAVSTPFSETLVVNVLPGDSSITATDLAEGFITFTAPTGSVASATFSEDAVGLVASDDGSDSATATVTATANGIAGSYYVVATSSADVAAPAVFSLNNYYSADPVPATPEGFGANWVYHVPTIDFNWSESGSAMTPSGYIIQESADGASGWTTVLTTDGDTNAGSWNPPIETSMYFRIAATVTYGSTTYTSAYSAPQFFQGLNGQDIEASAVVTSSSAQIQLDWPLDAQDDYLVTEYNIYRQILGSDSGWGSPIATLGGSVTGFVDNTVSAGTEYEYQINALNMYGGIVATQDIDAGIELPAVENRGTVILIVDNTFTTDSTSSTDLTPEIQQFEQELIGDGWNVIRNDVPESDTPQEVKAIIESDYNGAPDPSAVSQVLLLGHIAVPYAGGAGEDPDGHGAGPDGRYLPCDAYYGDMNPDDEWTQISLQSNDTSDPNVVFNVPNLNSITNTLAVGRIDLYGMPGLDPNADSETPEANVEAYLLQQYLAKDEAFRNGQLDVSQTAIWAGLVNGGSAYTQSVWNNFAAISGASGILSTNWGQFLPSGEEGYLFGYGNGAYGNGYFASNEELATNGAVFNLMFGSIVADWNVPYTDPIGVYPDSTLSPGGSYTNQYFPANSTIITSGNTGIDDSTQFLRAPLAGPGVGLVSVYSPDDSSGGANWQVYPMALGATIGSVELSYENGGASSSNYNVDVDTNILGDSTLSAYQVAPASNVLVAQSDGHNVVSWTASTDSDIAGYDIFRANSLTGTYTKINTSGPVSGTSFTDTSTDSTTDVYMVRAIKLQTTAGGTFYNAAEGSFSDPSASASIVGIDSSTGGSWVGTYGSQGYDVVGAASSIPSYAQLSTFGTQIASGSTTNTDALEDSPTDTTDTSNSWLTGYGNNFSVNLALTGGVHSVSLYVLDWQYPGEAETIDVWDSNTGSLLQTADLSNFGNGKYLNLDLQGNITITFIGVSSEAVLSGIFFNS
jgi:hypothetical protein